MRILSVVQTYYPFLEGGGAPWKVAALGKELVAARQEVSVVTADLGLTRGLGALGVRPNGELRAHRGWTTYEHDGVVAHYLPVVARWRAVTVNLALLRFCREELPSFDLVHVFGLYDLLGAGVGAACRRRGIPYVLEPMGMIQPIVRSLRKKRLYHATLGAPLVRGAARVVATSEQELDDIVRAGVARDRVVVRRNGLDLSPFRDLPAPGAFRREIGAAKDDFLLLFLGRLSKKKGLDLLVRVVAHLPPRVRAAIVGPDDGDGALAEARRLARELGVQDRVTFHPPRYERAKLEALVDADLFVLPSQHENFGNAVVEAIACGTPALVTDRCGVAPLVAERAGIVVPLDADAIRAAVRRAMEDPHALARMRAAAPAVAKELSWSEPVAQMIALYGELGR